MTARRLLTRPLTARWLVGVSALALVACQEEFPLGSWGSAAAGGAGSPSMLPNGGAGAVAGAPGMHVSPSCNELGIFGALNPPGPINMSGSSNIGTTNLYTDWSWPTPVDSLEWDLVMESDPEHDGYYWAHQFSFVNGLTGFFGLQAHGGFQLTLDAKPEFVKMAVFWIGGAELTGELGDIQSPDARALVVNARGAEWMTIHAKYEWSMCTVYRLRMAKDGTDESGNVWYAAWVEDRSTMLLTKIGRIAVPEEWGQVSRLTTTLTTRIDDIPPQVTSCDQPQPASAIFGTPSANDGQLVPTHTNRFAMPTRCASSRFTELPEGVRHEIAVPQTQ